MSNRLSLQVAALLFAALGLVIWLSEGFALPARTPPVQFHFSGVSLLMLGASPMTFASILLALARGLIGRDDRITQIAMVIGLALLGLAFVFSVRH